jgi:hypothetical protein
MSTNRIAGLFPAREEPAVDQRFEALTRKQMFEPGCRVRVCVGVMEGVEGTVLAYCAHSRLLIAVDIDCQDVTLEVDEQNLTPFQD